MNRFGRSVRRPDQDRGPDQWSSPHDRARYRAAERIDTALEPAEAAWLDAHLAECARCTAIAAAYDADRMALRTLRDVRPEPPRDLWARTAAGIEREARQRGTTGRVGAGPRRPSRIPVATLSAVAVVAVVVGGSLLAGRWFDRPSLPAGSSGPVAVATVPGSAGPSIAAAPTPMAVKAGTVTWVRSSADGSYAINRADIDKVCPTGDRPGCAALDDAAAQKLILANAPKTVISAPHDQSAVVVSSDGSGNDQVLVVVLPTVRPTAPPSPSASPSSTPSATPNPTATGSGSPNGSASPSPTTTPAPTASPLSPSPTPSPTASAGTSESPAPTPSDSSASGSPSPTPTVSPEPSVAVALAIASGVTVVGESASFSEDGAWFAFSARPSDGSAGPDIYAWHVGDQQAVKLTNDGASIFASWAGERIVGSRPVGHDLGDGRHHATSFLVDPATGTVEELGVPLWRPAVDPTGRYALAWDGTVVVGQDGLQVHPDVGGLQLLTWPIDPTAIEAHDTPLDDKVAIGDFDIRWDETGQWVAIWTTDPTDATVGRLSLLHLDPATGELTRPDGAPTDVPALAGFSIADSRLAWVTPQGQDAEGSRVQVAAWSADHVGAVESVPGEDVVIVR